MKKQFFVQVQQAFSFKDKMKILFGHHILVRSTVEVDAGIPKGAKKVEINLAHQKAEFFLGRPAKNEPSKPELPLKP